MSVRSKRTIELVNKAVDFAEQGNIRKAKSLCHKVFTLERNDARAAQLMGLMLRNEQQIDAAISYFQRARLHARPDDDLNTILIDLARCYDESGEPNQALECLDEVIGRDMTNVTALEKKGAILNAQGDLQGALAVFKQVVFYPPSVAENSMRARVLAHWHIMTTPLLTPLEFDIDLLRRDIRATTIPQNRASLNFALGNGLERREDYEGAYEAFCLANRMIAQTTGFDGTLVHRQFNEIQDLVNEHKSIPPISRSASKSLIFVCGMPRSGTTLVESVLAEHPEVYAGGELNYVREGITKLWGEDRIADDMRESLLIRFAQFYEERAGLSGVGERYFVDKMPINFVHADLLLHAFPNVKLISTRKNPVEACFSIFRVNFKHPASHGYAYRLPSIVLMYKWQQKLTDRLKSLYPTQVFDWHYEECIERGERTWRELFEFLELDWDDRYLDFYTSKRTVHTISSAQVRQPISNAYLNRAGRYGDLLKELDELLAMDLSQLSALSN